MIEGNERDGIRRGRQRKFLSSVVLVGLGMAGAVAGFMLSRHAVGDTAMGAGVTAGIGVGFLIVGVIVAWKSRPGDTRWMTETTGTRRDRLQTQRTNQLMIIPLLSLLFMGQAFVPLDHILSAQIVPLDYLRLLVPVLYAWLTPLIVMGWDGKSRQNRKYLEDELTQVMRTRAIMAAFFVLMAGVTLALGLALWQPAIGIVTLPFVLALAGATAGLRFAWLDREAGRDG